MSTVLGWVKGNPARTMAVATVVLGWLALAGVPAGVVAGLGTILGAVLAVPVHNAVTPVSNLVPVAQSAAARAASATARALSDETAGVAGSITDTGAQVAAMAAIEATHSALKELGVSRKTRATVEEH